MKIRYEDVVDLCEERRISTPEAREIVKGRMLRAQVERATNVKQLRGVLLELINEWYPS